MIINKYLDLIVILSKNIEIENKLSLHIIKTKTKF